MALWGARSQEQALRQVTGLEQVARQVDALRYYDADVSGWQAFVVIDALTLSPEAALAPDGENLVGLDESRVALDADFAAVDRQWLTASEEALLDQLEELWQQYWEVDEQMRELIAAGNTADAATLINSGASANIWDSLVATIDELTNSVDGRADEARASAELTAATTRWIGIGSLIAAVILGAALLWRTIGNITSRLKGMVTVLGDVQDGRLDVRADVGGQDEVAQMGTALNTALDSITAALRRVREQADIVETSATQVAGASTQAQHAIERTAAESSEVEDAAQQIASAVQALAAATEQMTTSIHEIADSAATAAGVAHDAVQTADGTTTVVTRLQNSTKAIEASSKAITAIADQTNLLALNATIEAARAGEAGKGFAVVAGEVKELAAQTGRATEQITAQVMAIENDTNGTSAAIVQIQQVINTISDLQSTIAAAVEQQSATAAEMSRQGSRAAADTEAVGTRLTTVAGLTANVRQDITQTDNAASTLAAAATELRNSVAHFHGL